MECGVPEWGLVIDAVLQEVAPFPVFAQDAEPAQGFENIVFQLKPALAVCKGSVIRVFEAVKDAHQVPHGAAGFCFQVQNVEKHMPELGKVILLSGWWCVLETVEIDRSCKIKEVLGILEHGLAQFRDPEFVLVAPDEFEVPEGGMYGLQRRHFMFVQDFVYEEQFLCCVARPVEGICGEGHEFAVHRTGLGQADTTVFNRIV